MTASTLRLGRGVEDDCKACIPLATGRGTQHNVRRWPRSSGLAKRKIAEDVVAALQLIGLESSARFKAEPVFSRLPSLLTDKGDLSDDGLAFVDFLTLGQAAPESDATKAATEAARNSLIKSETNPGHPVCDYLISFQRV